MDIDKLTVIYLNQLSGFGPKTIAKLLKKLSQASKIWKLNSRQLKKLDLSSYKIKS